MYKVFYRLRFILSLVMLPCLVTVSFAQACNKSSPIMQMKCVSEGLLVSLKNNQFRLNKPDVVKNIIYKNVVPYFDVNTMAKSVVGRRFWYGASSSVQQEFIQRFKRLVVSTYAAAIEKYDGDTVQFYPLRGDISSYKVVGVKSLIKRESGQNIEVVYMLRKKNEGWRVFDFSIENISMVQSYQSQFKNDLNNGGLKALVNKLRSKQGS